MKIVKLGAALLVSVCVLTSAAFADEAPKADASASPAAAASPAPTKKVYVCDHCKVTKDAAGKCDKCNMDLVEKDAPAAEEKKEEKKEEEKH